MSILRTIVIDDEKPSREVLCNYIRDYCKDAKVVATASSVNSGFRAIRKHKPDLVFLDIELSDGNGFDLLGRFEKIDFKVVFVTAYSEYAVKAFRYSAVDYLLKPVIIEELTEACEKAKKIKGVSLSSEIISDLVKNLKFVNNNDEVIVIPHAKGFEVLKINDIIMCQADGYCTNFHLTGKRKIVSSKNLKNYEELLSNHDFTRVHHSYLVNINHVCSYTRQGEIIMTEGLRASLGDVYKEHFTGLFLKKNF